MNRKRTAAHGITQFRTTSFKQKIMTSLPKYGVLRSNMVKNANFRGLRRIWDFLPTLRGIMIISSSLLWPLKWNSRLLVLKINCSKQWKGRTELNIWTTTTEKKREGEGWVGSHRLFLSLFGLATPDFGGRKISLTILTATFKNKCAMNDSFMTKPIDRIIQLVCGIWAVSAMLIKHIFRRQAGWPFPMNSLLATTWKGGHVGGVLVVNTIIFFGRIYVKIGFSSQRREMLLFLTTNLAAMT